MDAELGHKRFTNVGDVEPEGILVRLSLETYMQADLTIQQCCCAVGVHISRQIFDVHHCLLASLSSVNSTVFPFWKLCLPFWLEAHKSARLCSGDPYISAELVDGLQMQGKDLCYDWGHMPLLLLDCMKDVLEGQGDITASIPLLKVARLLNRHWSQWATQAMTYLSATGVPIGLLMQRVMTKFRNIRCIRLKNCGIAEGELIMLSRIQMLAHLDLEGCTTIVTEHLEHLSLLTNLTYIKLPKSQSLGEIKIWMRKLKSLKSVCLSNCTPICNRDTLALARRKSLTHLEVRLDASSNANRIVDDLARLTNLSHLSIQDANQVSGEGASYLASLTELTYLSLCNCSALSDIGLQHLALLTDLRHLNIMGCSEVSDEGVGHLSSLSGLRYLNLGGCRQLTNNGLWHLSSLTLLAHLELVGCRQITTKGVLGLVYLKQLRHLDLSWCNKVRWVGMLTCLRKLTRLEIWGCPEAWRHSEHLLATMPSLKVFR